MPAVFPGLVDSRLRPVPLLAQRFAPRWQAAIILALLLLTIVLLPITPSNAGLPEIISAPTWNIIKLLSASVGMCYFLLLSISPLMQSWFSRTQTGLPHTVFTRSRISDRLLAIVGYPFIVEPNLGWDSKHGSGLIFIWFLRLSWACAHFEQWKARYIQPIETASPVQEPGNDTSIPFHRTYRVLWLGAAALSSGMLMATTNQLCQDVAVVPLLWLLPMGLYLLSYILCFHSARWCSRFGFGIALAVPLGQTCWIRDRGIYIGLPCRSSLIRFTLFVCCMVCHGELVRLKHAPRIIIVLLMLSAGGGLKRRVVTLIAPHIFKGYWEFHLGLAGSAIFFLVVLFCDRKGPLYHGRPPWAWSLLCLASLVLVAALSSQIRGTLKDTVAMKRNFFGTLKILNDNPLNLAEHRIVLMHGRIEHGYQFASPEKHAGRHLIWSNSGAGIAIRLHPRRLDPRQKNTLRISIVGLGTGTLAAYGKHGDYFRFYEINPDVIHFWEQILYLLQRQRRPGGYRFGRCPHFHGTRKNPE